MMVIEFDHIQSNSIIDYNDHGHNKFTVVTNKFKFTFWRLSNRFST
jgi:hypothetical protein